MMDVKAMEQRVKMASCTDAKKTQIWLNSFILKKKEEYRVKVIPMGRNNHCKKLCF